MTLKVLFCCIISIPFSYLLIQLKVRAEPCSKGSKIKYFCIEIQRTNEVISLRVTRVCVCQLLLIDWEPPNILINPNIIWAPLPKAILPPLPFFTVNFYKMTHFCGLKLFLYCLMKGPPFLNRGTPFQDYNLFLLQSQQ